jgi:hypothetical protein
MRREQLTPHFKTHGKTLDLFKMLLNRGKIHQIGNHHYGSHFSSVSHWEERTVLCVAPALECIGDNNAHRVASKHIQNENDISPGFGA